MADDTNTQNQSQPGQEPAKNPTQAVDTAKGTQAAPAQKDDILDIDKLSPADMVKLLKATLTDKRKANSEAANYRKKLEELDAEKAKKAEAEALARGEHERLFKETKALVEPLQSENKQLKETLKTVLDSQLERLSAAEVEQFNALFGDLDPKSQLDKFAVWSKGLKLANPTLPVGAPASQVADPKQQTGKMTATVNEAKEKGDEATLARMRQNLRKYL